MTNILKSVVIIHGRQRLSYRTRKQASMRRYLLHAGRRTGWHRHEFMTRRPVCFPVCFCWGRRRWCCYNLHSYAAKGTNVLSNTALRTRHAAVSQHGKKLISSFIFRNASRRYTLHLLFIGGLLLFYRHRLERIGNFMHRSRDIINIWFLQESHSRRR